MKRQSSRKGVNLTRKQVDALVSSILTKSKPLHPGRATRLLGIIKAIANARGASLQEPLTSGSASLLVSHPFSFTDAQELKAFNEHHAACVRVKKWALMGLGLRNRKFERQLNQLCQAGPTKDFFSLMDLVVQDYEETGNGMVEVVRQWGSKKILGLHHLPSPNAEILAFRDDGLLAFQAKSGLITSKGMKVQDRTVRIMAEFGRSDELLKQSPGQFQKTKDGRYSEVIHFKANSNLNRYYGVPDWLSVVSTCELVGAVKQHVFDFFNNRGVPALLLFLTGGYISTETWDEITQRLQENVGEGKAHRTNAFHIQDPETKVTAQQLSPQSTDNGTFFQDMMGALASITVSAHGVPPRLAGVEIPGKLGSVNDLINAIIVYQTMGNGPKQRYFEGRLWDTLGDSKLNGGLVVPAASDDSDGPFELRSPVEEMAETMTLLQPANNVAQSRQPVPDQAAEGRPIGGPLRS